MSDISKHGLLHRLYYVRGVLCGMQAASPIKKIYHKTTILFHRHMIFLAPSSSPQSSSLRRGPLKTIANTIAVAIVFAFCLQASAESLYRTSSSIVVDAENNKTLFDSDADSLAYPASLTKTMTLVLLFDQLKSGRWQTDKLLNVSATAAKRPKTRLGLRAGDKISVDLAIRSIVVLSANDSAVVVSENIAGSEAAFTSLMNRKAKDIGMTKTRFLNASGLPSAGQVTTARDMATLGLYILNNYPQYYHYFSIDKFVFKNRTIFTHNRVLEKFNGADGFKTGFISRSGYNLLTSAERDGKRVVAVVLGGNTATQRDSIMTFLLDRYIPYAQVYTNSFGLRQMKQANATPQGALKDAYKKYIKPPETAAAKAARLKQARMAAEIKKRRDLRGNLLTAGKPPTATPRPLISTKQAKNKTVKIANNKNVKQVKNKTVKTANNKNVKTAKNKTVKIASDKKTKQAKNKKKSTSQAIKQKNSSRGTFAGNEFITSAHAEPASQITRAR